MLKGKNIGVVVPAFNEQKLIKKTLTTMPSFVDKIIVVNDGSTDNTAFEIKEFLDQDSRIIHIEKERNEGLGKAIIDGYRKAYEMKLDVVAVMAGDAQMDPKDLEKVVLPIIKGQAVYVKGNRLLFRDTIKIMPRHRFFGNSILTILNKFATGYFDLMDPQCGFTAIEGAAIKYFDTRKPHKGYGYNAHLLYQLNLRNFKVVDVGVKPIYGESISKIKLYKYIPKIFWLILSLFFKRIWYKYLVYDFHPIGLCYVFGTISGLVSLYTGILILLTRFKVTGPLPITHLPTIMLCVLSSFIFILLFLFGMLLDIEYLRSHGKTNINDVSE